jgi:putative DNA primase/helicase
MSKLILTKKINHESLTEKEEPMKKKKTLWTRTQSNNATTIAPEMDIEDMLINSMVTVDEFIATKMPAREMILFPWLKTGTITLISAQRGIGKTFLSTAIALSVTRQADIGLWHAENPAKCVFVDAEMASDQFQSRLNKLIINLPEEKAPLYIVSSDLMKWKKFQHPNIANPEWRDSIMNIVSDTGFRVLILDNIASLTPGRNENIKKHWDPLNQWLLELRANKVAVVMIHHAGKNSKQRGTSAIEDNIDNSIYLSRPADYRIEQGARFNIEFTKTRDDLGKAGVPFCLHFKKSGDGEIWTTETPKPELKYFIITLLSLKVPQNEIAKILRCDESNVLKVMKLAIMKGLLDKNCDLIGEGIKLFGEFTVEEVLDEFNS